MTTPKHPRDILVAGGSATLANILAIAGIIIVLGGGVNYLLPGAASETPAPPRAICTAPECGVPDLLPPVIVQTRHGRRDPEMWWRDPWAQCEIVEYVDATNRVIFRNTHC